MTKCAGFTITFADGYFILNNLYTLEESLEKFIFFFLMLLFKAFY